MDSQKGESYDGSAIKSCASLSYQHPLGFEKLTLIDARPVFVLRLHAWWPRHEPSLEHVHNHRFGLASVVLIGGYDMQVFQADRSGTQVREYRESSRPCDTTWRLDSVGTAQLRLLTSTRVIQGSGYALAADVLHKITVPPDRLCVTLFLETASVVSATHVFVPQGSTSPANTSKQTLTGDDYRRRLAALAAELGR
jgi:hypothetical protein